MDERQDLETKDKNIAQLMVELTTVQAQIKLVKAAIFMNKQKAAISDKMKNLKEYAKGQAEKYSQNIEEANKAMETYRGAVEEAMQQYKEDYLDAMAKQDKYQDMEVKTMGKEKKLASALKEQRKTPEYKEWKQEVKNLNKEIKANANDPEKLAILAEQLKALQAKDPTLLQQQMIDLARRDRAGINEMIKFYDKELEIIQNKETSLAKIQKQNIWQKLVARFTSKSKSFKNNVVTPLVDKAAKIKNEKIPQIIEDRKTKKQERKAKREETIKKMKDFKDRVGDKIVDAKDSTVEISKRGIRAVVEFGREAKKATVKAIEGIGTKAAETRENVKEGLRTAVEQSSQKLEDLNDAR